ncbi:hypothetical protein NONI108955_06240 [Nocardia ninae]
MNFHETFALRATGSSSDRLYRVARLIDGRDNSQRIQQLQGRRSTDEFESSYHQRVPVGTR